MGQMIVGLWIGTRAVSGYGLLWDTRRGYKIAASRVSYEIANGPIPEGMQVLHSCDNPPCVNPAHLRVGTNHENVLDRARRQRGREHRQQGEANANARLEEEEVRAVIARLESGETQVAIADDLGVSQAQISRIARREQWAHLWPGS